MEIKLGQDKKKLEEKHRQEENALNDLSSSLKNIDKRYFTVQKSFHNLDNDIDQRDDDWQEEILEFTEQLEQIKKDMGDLQQKANDSIALMKKIIVRFKNSSKKEDYDNAYQRLNDWKVENYITKDRFKKILLQEIDKRL